MYLYTHIGIYLYVGRICMARIDVFFNSNIQSKKDLVRPTGIIYPSIHGPGKNGHNTLMKTAGLSLLTPASYIYTYIDIHFHIYIYIYICMYVYVHMYTFKYTHISKTWSLSIGFIPACGFSKHLAFTRAYVTCVWNVTHPVVHHD